MSATRYHATASVKDVSESPWRSRISAVVTVTWPGGESVVYTNEDSEPVTDAPANVLAVARAALDLLPVEAWEGDSAEGVFEVVDGGAVEVVTEAA